MNEQVNKHLSKKLLQQAQEFFEVYKAAKAKDILVWSLQMRADEHCRDMEIIKWCQERLGKRWSL